MYFNLKVSTYTYTTREPYENDSWDRGDTETDWTFVDESLSEKPELDYSLEFETTLGAKEYYLFYSIYHTGDSFGHDSNSHIDLMEVFTNYEEMKEFEKLCESSKTYDFQYKNKTYYRAWWGHFNGLGNFGYAKISIN